jgi:hypothetical protein
VDSIPRDAAGLDPKKFAFHSLKKEVVTRLSAYGIEREEANASGNYSKEPVMEQNPKDTGRQHTKP